MESRRNTTVFLNRTSGATTLPGDATFAAFASNGTAGEIMVFNAETNAALASGGVAAAMSSGIYVGHKTTSGVIRSNVIYPRNITALKNLDNVAGSASSVVISSVSDIDCETEYCLKIRYESPEIAKTYGYQDMVKTYSYVTRCCGSSCGCPDGAVWDVLMGLAEQVNNDPESGMNLTNEHTIEYARVLNSTDPTASNDPDEVWTLTQGSDLISCANDIDYASGTQVAAGDFIRIMNGGGTVTKADGDVFRVESVDTTANTITLDRPWPYATQDLDTTGDAEVIPKATGEAFADSTWTMGIAGAALQAPTAPVDTDYTPAHFTDIFVGLSCSLDCNGTVTKTDPVQPIGHGADMANLMYRANRNKFAKNPYLGSSVDNMPRSGEDYYDSSAVADGYDQWIIEWTNVEPSGLNFETSIERLIIACDDADTTFNTEWDAMLAAIDTATPSTLLTSN